MTARARAQDPEPVPVETVAPHTPVATRAIPLPSPTSADTLEPAKHEASGTVDDMVSRPETSPIAPAPPAQQRQGATLPDPGVSRITATAPEAVESDPRVVPGAETRGLPSPKSAPPPGLPTARAIAPSDPEPIPVAEDTPEPVDQETTEAVSPEPEVVDSDTRFRLIRGQRLPAPARPAPDREGCDCEVEGTVEVRSDRPLSRPVVVSISLGDAPAYRDSVELFMGSPREFRLGRVPCGSHELVVVASSKRFTVAPTVPSGFECVADRLRQFRIVLETR